MSDDSRVRRVLDAWPVVAVPLLLAAVVYLGLQNRALLAQVDLMGKDVAAMHAQVLELKDDVNRVSVAVGSANAQRQAQRAARSSKQGQGQAKKKKEVDPEVREQRQQARAERQEALEQRQAKLEQRQAAQVASEGQPRRGKKRRKGQRRPAGDPQAPQTEEG